MLLPAISSPTIGSGCSSDTNAMKGNGEVEESQGRQGENERGEGRGVE